MTKAYDRKKTKAIQVGKITVGADAPIAIQSMTNTDTRDVLATVNQINTLESAGCELVRVSVPDMASAQALPAIKSQIQLPLIADIHFDYRLAVAAAQNGADKLRINPGNIGSKDRVKAVAECCADKKIPIRVGVNAGSLEKKFIAQYGGVTAEGIADSVLAQVDVLESVGFNDLILSVKASSVPLSIRAYELVSKCTDYPLHVGITEAGTPATGIIKSAAGIGAVLSKGIGDTIRISLTGDPVHEVTAARDLLQAMEIRYFGIEFISCPTCARTKVDIAKIADEIRRQCIEQNIHKNIKVAIMGCSVNGPGESREADIGLAAGDGFGLIFKKGVAVGRYPENELIEALMDGILAL